MLLTVDGPQLLRAGGLAAQGTERAYTLARKHGVRLGFGTDILFSPEGASRQGAHLAKLTRWFEPLDVVRQATSRNAELLQLSGPRAPYAGPLGVIEPGALADVLVVDGDPTRDVSLLARPELLLLDEPTASLDARNEGLLRHTLGRAAADRALLLGTVSLRQQRAQAEALGVATGPDVQRRRAGVL